MSADGQPKYPELFPIAMGNEEEGMLMTGRSQRELTDPEEFVTDFDSYLPETIKRLGNAGVFLQNGGLMYDGGGVNLSKRTMVTGVTLERATPECATPRELATYVEASERLYVSMLKNFVEHWAMLDETMVARAHRRVIAPNGATKASHDSLESRRPAWLDKLSTNNLGWDGLHTFLASRSFITGAGYVRKGGMYFAQKVQQLESLDTYGYFNSAIRIVSDSGASKDDTGPRLEVRCNDINISPWAVQARIGGSALFFTMLQTPVAEALRPHLPSIHSNEDIFRLYRRFNNAFFDKDGRLHASQAVGQAVDFQERAWELMDEDLSEYVELSDEYQTLISQVRYYIEDFRKVVAGQEPLERLADRSDAAAKFSAVFRRRRTHPWLYLDGKQALMQDSAMDLKYDSIFAVPDSTGKAKISKGYGLRMRDEGRFKMAIPSGEIDKAITRPPQKTRAKIRGDLVRTGQASWVSWSHVRKENTLGSEPLGPVMLSE